MSIRLPPVISLSLSLSLLLFSLSPSLLSLSLSHLQSADVHQVAARDDGARHVRDRLPEEK